MPDAPFRDAVVGSLVMKSFRPPPGGDPSMVAETKFFFKAWKRLFSKLPVTTGVAGLLLSESLSETTDRSRRRAGRVAQSSYARRFRTLGAATPYRSLRRS